MSAQQHILLFQNSGIVNTLTRAGVNNYYVVSKAMQGNNAKRLELIEHSAFIVVDMQLPLS